MSDSNTRKYYRARAAEYEQIYYRRAPERRQEIADECERLRDLVRGKSVLDLACGTGYWTQIAAETAGEIVAIDQAPEMISEARKKEYCIPVNFIEGDMFTYGFGRRFDIVLLGFWFSHQPREEYGKLFGLLGSLATPGGLVWMIDNNPPAEGGQQDSVGADEHGNNYKKRHLDNGTEFVILKNYFTEGELRRIVSEHANPVRITYKTYYWSAVLEPRLAARS